MEIAVIGTGRIGTAVGTALARSGHQVTFGTRQPADGAAAGESLGATVADIAGAIGGAMVVIVAIPAAAVDEFAAANGAALAGKLVIDATNRMGADVNNSQAAYTEHAPGARYARSFNCLGLEVLLEPMFDGVAADMFFACEAPDRATVEEVVAGVGLRPVYVGADPGIVDGVFRLWIALAIGQGRGRHLGFRTLERAG